MSGWFAMSRAMFDHPIFKGHPERVAGWAWILATAAWKDTRMDANGKTVPVKRGQLLTSYRQMSAATGIPVQPLRTLISRLRDEHAINTDTSNGRLLITVCKYEKYQSTNDAANTTTNTVSTQDQHTKEQDNNIPVGAAEKSAASDPVKLMFDSGRELLCGAGKSNAAAGKLLGKWRKEYGTADVISAIGNARREGAIDPVSFIEGTLRFRQKRGATAPRADSRTEHAGAFGILREAGV
jgi:hypothetical protein